MGHAEIVRFFDAYRDAFNRLDGDAVAALWHSASGIADVRDGLARIDWWPEPAPMCANHRALCALYREAGYGRADYTLLDAVPMGTHHAFAHLRWTIDRADGGLLQTFATGYQLMRTADGPRVLLCTAYQEDPEETRRHAAQ
jgi:hypothetical protein